MNKYKEAFNDIVDYGLNNDYFNNEARKSEEENRIMIVQQAVDRFTPIKPKEEIPNEDGTTWGKCECGISIRYLEGMIEDNYCRYCGQALDWSDEDE